MDVDDSLEGLKWAQCIKRDTQVVRRISLPKLLLGFLGGSVVKYPPAMQGTPAGSLGQKDALEKEMATHFNFLAQEISWTKDPRRLQSRGLQKCWTQLSD